MIVAPLGLIIVDSAAIILLFLEAGPELDLVGLQVSWARYQPADHPLGTFLLCHPRRFM